MNRGGEGKNPVNTNYPETWRLKSMKKIEKKYIKVHFSQLNAM